MKIKGWGNARALDFERKKSRLRDGLRDEEQAEGLLSAFTATTTIGGGRRHGVCKRPTSGTQLAASRGGEPFPWLNPTLVAERKGEKNKSQGSQVGGVGQ